MPTGPKGQKRPADVIGNAVRVIKIATGEIDEVTPIDDGKDPAAKALGAKGGAAPAKAETLPRRHAPCRKLLARPGWQYAWHAQPE